MLALIVTALTYVLRALRWQYLLAPIGPTHFANAFRTTVIGFAASFLLPARAGEVIRPYLLARKEGLSATAAFATIILERLLDLITVLLLFGVFVALIPGSGRFGRPDGVCAGQAWRTARGARGADRTRPSVRARWPPGAHGALGAAGRAGPAGQMARAVASFVESFAQGLAVMRQPLRLLVALAWSFPFWLSIAAGIWLTSLAFHITFPFAGTFLVTMLLVVGVAMPTPGAIGGFHAAYQIAVQTFFAAPTDRAVGGAIVLHAISFVPVTILGVVFMAREGLTLGRARTLAAEAGEGDTPDPNGGSDRSGPAERFPQRIAGAVTAR